jgi:hypothetical protein
VQHKFIVDEHANAIAENRPIEEAISVRGGGDGRPADFLHRSRCHVCAALISKPHLQRSIDSWVRWERKTVQVAMDLGVSTSVFNRHVQYYGLDKRKGEKANTLLALQRAAEEGLASGGHSVKTGLTAMREISRQRGDVVNVDQRTAVVDLSSLSVEELMRKNQELLEKLAAMEQGR